MAVEAGSPASPRRTGSAARVVFVGAAKKPNFVVESYKMPGSDYPLKEGEILLKMLVATICEEDLEVLTNDGPATGNHPRVLGHEGVGEVVSIGPCKDSSGQVDNLRPGDRLVFSPWSGVCSQCSSCAESRFMKCLRAERYGFHTVRHGESSNGPVIQGGTFASHLVLRQGTQVALLPDGLPDSVASPLACVLAPLVKAAAVLESVSRKQVAVIQGASLRGAYLCALLRESCFEQVYCLDSDPEALKLISRFGGIPVHEARHLSTGSGNHRVPRPGPCKADAVVRLAGTNSPLHSAIDLLKSQGCLVLAGGTGVSWTSRTPDFKYGPCDLMNWEKVAQKEITVKGVCGYGGSEIRSAVDFVHRTSSKYPYGSLLSPTESALHDFPSALTLARSNTHCRVPVITS